MKPNFFIVGAPRSGTTALYERLRQHADVFMPERKEPHFFGTDLQIPHGFADEAAYVALFAGAGGATRVGEASVWYLCSESAAREIAAFAPDARIIVMLRNPADMVHSLHAHRLFSGKENIAAFREALDAEPDRRRGRRLPPAAHPVKGLFYSALGRYNDQVRRYVDAFGRARVHVIVFEDFVAEPDAVFRETCAHLGIDTAWTPRAEIVNAHKVARSPLVRRLLHRPPPIVRRAVRTLMPGAALRSRAYVGFRRLNGRQEARPSLDPALRERLNRLFADDVERLSSLIDRDLTGWCRS